MSKRARLMILFAAAVLGISSAAAAAAYYEDMISHEKCLVRAADVSFGSDRNIRSDLGEQNSRLLPFAEGDGFDISFTAVYEGDIEAYAVPCLKTNIAGMSENDIVRISDGSREIYISGGTGSLFSDAIKLMPSDSINKTYHITIVRHKGTEPLLFSYEFSVAAIQKRCNERAAEELLNGNNGAEELYKDIAESVNGTKNSRVSGFGDITVKSEKASDKAEDGAVRYYLVDLEPQITNGYTSAKAISWYAKISDKEEKIADNRETLELALNKYNISDGLELRYEVKNEAGYISSDRYIFSLKDDELICRRRSCD